MENQSIIYSTPEQQIEKLKHQGMIIEDEVYAKTSLEIYGYFNLIKSYRDPYMITENGEKHYRSGVTFDQILSLYVFDKNLRNAVMACMIDFEEHLKAITADVVASSFGTHQDDYLNFKNYRDKKKKKYRFSLPGILNTLRDTLNTDKNPIAHYTNEHGIVPPWILFKSIYFSTIVNYIDLFKPKQRLMVANRLFDFSNWKFTEEEQLQILHDALFIFSEYRNIAAHGGRIYSYQCDSKLRLAESNPIPSGFGCMLFLLRLMNYQQPFNYLNSALNSLVSDHCSNYPEDTTYLGKILDLNIVRRNVVWISQKSKRYHLTEHCSGLCNAIKVDLQEALQQKYTPCKKCCK